MGVHDDGEIVRAVVGGARERYAELVDRHANAVFRLVRATVSHDADAEDLAQEIFVAAFRGLEGLRDAARFRPWLLGIAARKAADHVRRRLRRPSPEPLAAEPEARPAEQAPDRMSAIEAIVAALPPESRLLFALRHHEGLACTQIARLLDVPEGTVYSRLSRIHAAIRKAAGVKDR
jgi:RNA polymerase sigma-70 factor (ECF subfamily)